MLDDKFFFQIFDGFAVMISIGAALFSLAFAKLPIGFLIGALALALLNLILMIYISKKRISIYTQKGAEMTNQVRGFKKMLADVGHFRMRNVGDIILWEDIMPYAVAFGLAKKVLKQLKVEFGQEVLYSAGFDFAATCYSPGKVALLKTSRHALGLEKQRSMSLVVPIPVQSQGIQVAFLAEIPEVVPLKKYFTKVFANDMHSIYNINKLKKEGFIWLKKHLAFMSA
ncbi:DUF2207 domain-containing protein [Lactobacillus xujianguonis]|nr:DUF2207 domain-containing protein [Lactobacillus xujianguonis]RVU73938.1 DUF2207 domain-containing protein [Lactobacillus xujianguonis]